MEPIVWTQVNVPGGYDDVREGIGPEGRWWLVDTKWEARGSLTLPTSDEMLASYLNWPKDPDYAYMRDPEFRKVWAHISSQSDVIYCTRMEMLVRLIDRLRDPTPAAGTLVEILQTNEFVQSENIPELYQLDIGKGSIYAWTKEGHFKAEYHGNMTWWLNMVYIMTAQPLHKGGFHEIYWPESYGDVEAKAAEFLVQHYIPWVRSRRITRRLR